MALNWFRLALQLKGSVILIVIPRISLFTGIGGIAVWLHTYHPIEALQIFGNLTTNVIYSLVLGLLLVFRTNTAYDRYWEGRKALGMITVNIRNLAREISVGIAPQADIARAQKKSALQLLTAFAIATKLHLRQESPNQELEALLTEAQFQKLKMVKNAPLELALWISTYLQQQYQCQHLDSNRFLIVNESLNNMIEGLTGCERIANTPIPLAYGIYLKRLTLIYCLALPFYLASEMGVWSIAIVAIISFVLLGVEEIGNEIENPFGYDLNDLPVDEICRTISDNVESMSNFVPDSQTS